MKRVSLFFLLAVFSCVSLSSLHAQDYAIEITSDKKLIHVSKLPLPGSMTLIEYLLTLPELADRNGDTFLERYDFKIDGKIVYESKDAIMANMLLRDIKTIEISTSPADSHIKNGISGSVNIVPVSIEKGVGGDVDLRVGIPTATMTVANIRYSDGKKFELRADADLDLYYPKRVELLEGYTKTLKEFETDTIKFRSVEQQARIYAKWNISDQDVLKVWVWQNYSSKKKNVFSNLTRVEDKSEKMGPGWQYTSSERFETSSLSKNLGLSAIVDYTRKISTGELKANADYHFNNDYQQKKDELNAELKSVTNFKIPQRGLKMEIGLNSSVNTIRGQNNRRTYLSPILKFDFNGKYIKATLNGRYKTYARSFALGENKPYHGWYHDWTAEANVLWQIVDHHALRLKLIRNVGVPADADVYPELFCDPATKVWRKGNPKLRGPVTKSANLEYITDWSKGAHSLIFNFSAECNIQSQKVDYNLLHDTKTETIYLYPVNSVSSSVLGLSAMLNYSYGPFYISFGAEYFYNMEYARAKNLKGDYFNIKFNPSIQLKNNWQLKAAYIYNSKEYREHITLGESSIFNLGVSKIVGRWTFFLAIQDVFGSLATDVEKNSVRTSYRTYDPYDRSVVLGVNVRL